MIFKVSANSYKAITKLTLLSMYLLLMFCILTNDYLGLGLLAFRNTDHNSNLL